MVVARAPKMCLATTTASARGGCKIPRSKVVVVVAVVVAVQKVPCKKCLVVAAWRF